MKENISQGIAFILEGETEKEFYFALLNFYCEKYHNCVLKATRDNKTGEIFYILTTPTDILIIKMFVVGTISQLANSGTWFENNCHKQYPSLKWIVFLCYDTDAYMEPITKFYEGDWKELRKQLSKGRASEIIDLAAQADIEDIMLLDADSIFKYLNIAPCDIPNGAKGKRKMKKLFRSVGRGIAYHEGVRAKKLIEALNFEVIIEKAPLNFSKIEQECFGGC